MHVASETFILPQEVVVPLVFDIAWLSHYYCCSMQCADEYFANLLSNHNILTRYSLTCTTL